MTAFCDLRFFLQRFTVVLLVGIAAPTVVDAGDAQYLIQPGDVLRLSVWKEENLLQDVLVRPDGGISYPLAGDLQAAGLTPAALRTEIVGRIEQYIPDPVVTVQILQIEGNKIYVLGKVNRPGEYTMTRNLDVMQALAVAGGLATFADSKEISILRRTSDQKTAIPFNYNEVQYGRGLDQNILLQPGDVLVIP